VLGRFNSLYILTKEDGRLGHQDASSFETLIESNADPRVVSFVVLFAALGLTKNR